MDLQNLFTAVLNMTVTGSIVIGCVLAARFALGKAPRVFAWMLWLVVIFRLLCPVSVSGPVSVLEAVDVQAPREPVGAVQYVQPPAPLVTVTPADIPSGTAPEEPAVDWDLIGSRVWLTGVGLLAVWSMVSYVNLKRRLRESVPAEKGVRETDRFSTAFVLGATVYLPADLPWEERGYILLHERLHIRHGDPVVKGLFWLTVCIHWFNPLVWLAFFLCGRDMELRCDEGVLKKLGGAVRSDYAQSLLNAAGANRLAAPLAFGEGDTGKRVHFVLNWKKKKLWVGILAAVLCMAVLVLTGCDPAEQVDGPFGHSYKATMIVTSTQHIEPVEQDRLFTLTSDMALFIRNNEKTVMAGSFKELEKLPDLRGFSNLEAGTVHAWEVIQSGPNNYLLLQMMDGALYLIQGDQLYLLERTDLLGVSIKQPGMESYVEPVWYRPDLWNWMAEEMSTTLVDGDARIVLMPELEVDMILVSEDYYDRAPDQQTQITTTDYFLEPDQNGDFLLDVSRRSGEGDDYAVYRVTVGEEDYVFRLSFPAVPGETSVSSEELERIHTVAWAEGDAKLVLEIPGSWEYDRTSLQENDYCAGITFWPRGREEGKIRLEYYPQGFGVCGTGLETTQMELAGRTVTVGTYDGAALWDYISFGDNFAAWGEGHESWWAKYGEAAMAILNSAQFGK